MRSNLVLFGIGCVVGGLVVGLIVRESAQPTPRAERTQDVAFRSAVKTIEDLRVENSELRSRLDEAKRPDEPAPAPVPEAEKKPDLVARVPTEKDLENALRDFGSHFQELIYGTPAGKEAAKTLRAMIEAVGEKAITGLVTNFKDGTLPPGPRLISAHALAQSGDPAALEELKTQLRDPDADLILKRFASHALAFSDEKGLDTVLAEAARSDDLGVRANSAFGLQRRGVEEGVELYFAATDDALSQGDPQALQYLGGAKLIGEKALPFLRERLGIYKEEQALLVTILILQSRKDQESKPALEKLAYDSSRPKSVQNAAQAALKTLAVADQ